MRYIVFIFFALMVNCAWTAQNHTKVLTNIKKPSVSLKAKLNINKASVKEMQTLPNMNVSKARSIVRYRKQNGLFANLNSLHKVRGFKRMGSKKLSLYKAYFKLK